MGRFTQHTTATPASFPAGNTTRLRVTYDLDNGTEQLDLSSTTHEVTPVLVTLVEHASPRILDVVVTGPKGHCRLVLTLDGNEDVVPLVIK